MSYSDADSGAILISFDCEGKFGLADHLTPEINLLLQNASNCSAYDAILAALRRNGMRATFAFVGAFTLHPDQYPAWRDYFPEQQVNGRPCLEAFYRDAKYGRFDGWLNPGPLERVRVAGGHEVATHGFTHFPLDESTASPEIFDRELSAAIRLGRTRGDNIRTIVYPKNKVGHVTRLAAHGLVGYRAAAHKPGRFLTRCAGSFVDEFNLFARPETPDCSRLPVAIPSGHILNYHQSFGRRVVPRSVTLARWIRLLTKAAENGGVVHLWSHPHNFLTDPGLIVTFEQILTYAACLVREGRLRNLTMDEYCRLFGAA